ncbi:MAG: YceD family protein [Actinomycetes bacterium]
MRSVSRVVPAPAELGTDVVGVPQGSDVELELRLESVVEGVLVTGTARVHVEGECVRCLDPVSSEQEVRVQELYYYPDQNIDDGEAGRLEGDYLDLEPLLRDAVVLGLPFRPVCRDDCPGLCSECGAKLADHPGHVHEQGDPRWAALQALTIDAPGVPDDEEES